MAGDSAQLTMLSNARISSLFLATVQATEEAIVNAMLASDTMTGADNFRVYGLPADRVVDALRKYGRLSRPESAVATAGAPELECDEHAEDA